MVSQRLEEKFLVSIKIRQKDVFVVLFILLTIIPFLSIGMTQDPIPSITQEDGEIVNESEILLASPMVYSPKPLITTLNDTDIENESVWKIGHSDGGNTITYARYINVPFRNVTEVIFSASFSIQTGPANITIHNVKGSNTTVCQDNQDVTLSFIGAPSDTSENYAEPIRMFIDISGSYKEEVVVTGFWIQAVTNTTLYPVSVDIQNINGISLFSNPTMYDNNRFELMPRITIIDESSISNYFYPTQINDTMLLPIGNYSIEFTWWWYYHISSSFQISDDAIQLDWRIKCVSIIVKPTYPIPGYSIDFDYDSLYRSEYLLSDSPTFYLPQNRIWKIYIFGRHHSVSANIETGQVENISVWVDPNLVVIGSLAFSTGRLAIMTCLLLSILILGLANVKKFVKSSYVIPYSILILSFILPCNQYTVHPPGYFTISDNYSENTAFCPGLSSLAISTPDSLIHITYYETPYFIVLYILLLLVVIGILLDNSETKSHEINTNSLFGYSVIAIVITEFCAVIISDLSLIGTQITPLTIGLGPFIAVFSFIIWIVLIRIDQSQSSLIEIEKKGREGV